MFSHVADRKILSEGKSTLRKTTPSGVVFCFWRFLMDLLQEVALKYGDLLNKDYLIKASYKKQ